MVERREGGREIAEGVDGIPPTTLKIKESSRLVRAILARKPCTHHDAYPGYPVLKKTTLVAQRVFNVMKEIPECLTG